MTIGRHWIGGEWLHGAGEESASLDPATAAVVWQGREATAAEVDRAVRSARAAQGAWGATASAQRRDCLRAYRAGLVAGREDLAETISRETGKPHWEALTEVDAMAAKVDLTEAALRERCGEAVYPLGDGTGILRHVPLGVLAVLGPFNLPGHLPNGHILPALLSGNTVVFKPSEHAPLVAERMAAVWERAGLPAGVLNLVQGGRTTGGLLVRHGGLDGICFTGSYAAGSAIHRELAGRPETLLALEMGGNNPLLVWGVADRIAAAWATIRSAYITAGQRCTCARRLVVADDSEGAAFLATLVPRVRGIRVGAPADRPEPFLGPLISPAAARALLAFQEELVRRGAKSLVPMLPAGDCPSLLTPGLIDVTAVEERADAEHFGPLLQVVRVRDFEAALEEARSTAYGLAAGILTDDRDRYRRFATSVRAGVVTWNRPTTGASGRLPFGGLGRSGNHRPSGFRAVDCCVDLVALLEADALTTPEGLPPGLAEPGA